MMWRQSRAQVVREMDKEELALLVQFVTGTSKVPLEGFKALQARAARAALFTHSASKPGTPVRLIDLGSLW